MTGRPTGPGGCLRPWWRTMVRHCRMNHHKDPALTISNAKSVGDMLKSCESVATCFLSKKGAAPANALSQYAYIYIEL